MEHKHILSFINVFKDPLPDGNMLLTRLITVICIGVVYRPESQSVWHSAKSRVSVSLFCELYNQKERETTDWQKDGKWKERKQQEHTQ